MISGIIQGSHYLCLVAHCATSTGFFLPLWKCLYRFSSLLTWCHNQGIKCPTSSNCWTFKSLHVKLWVIPLRPPSIDFREQTSPGKGRGVGWGTHGTYCSRESRSTARCPLVFTGRGAGGEQKPCFLASSSVVFDSLMTKNRISHPSHTPPPLHSFFLRLLVPFPPK